MTSHRRNVAIIITGAVLLTFVYNFYTIQTSVMERRDKFEYNKQKLKSRVASPDKLDTIKTIQWFDYFNNGIGLRIRSNRNVRMDQCEYNNCVLLEHNIVPKGDKTIHGPLSADAVVFQACHLGNILPPNRRDENQVFVFAEGETWWYMTASEKMMDPALNKIDKRENKKSFPILMPHELKSFNKFQNIFRFRSIFNWTMTYRRDSDIYMPYGEILSRPDAIDRGYISRFEANVTEEKDYDRIFYSKTKEVVWLVSHCETKSKREYYVQRMSKYISVDIYGACGNFSCPKGKYEDPGKDSCMYKIIREYKFVLSFENTFHTGYATEKLFYWFPRDIVQVVYGMADYESITPPGTIINAADFKSPQDLAIFMKKIGADKKEYVKYLRNKNGYYSAGLGEMQQKAYCNLCEKLNNLDANRRTYPNIGLWWQNNDTSAFQNLYLQAFGLKERKRNVFHFIAFVCACVFFTVICSYLTGRQ